MRAPILLTLALTLGACQTGGGMAEQRPAPDAKAAILAAKGSLWKDPDSIKATCVALVTDAMWLMGWKS